VWRREASRPPGALNAHARGEQEELEVYLDNLPICVESDRCIDKPEFFLWTLKLAETIEQVSPSHTCCAAPSPEKPLGNTIGRVACAG
jgi:hypothetical protein